MTKLQLHYKIVDYKNGRVDWDSVSDAIDDYVKGLEVAKNISSNPVLCDENCRHERTDMYGYCLTCLKYIGYVRK